MPILSVDLTRRSWSDLGVVLLERKGTLIACDMIRWRDPSSPPVVELALRLNTVCLERNATVLMLDGPQAWKSEECGDTATKAGSPDTYERFVGYCLALYHALGRLGWQRLATRQPLVRDQPEKKTRILVESYPQAAWKSLGIAPLPAGCKCRVSHLAEAYSALTAILPITTSQPPNHSQIQAIVGGLPGLAIEEQGLVGVSILDPLPRWKDGRWRQGVNSLPLPPSAEEERSGAIHRES